VVPARSRRVDELAAPVRGPRVHEDHYARRHVAVGQQRVHGLGERRAKRRAVVPHRDRARVALDDVYRRIAPLGILVVARRHIHLDGAVGGVAERVVRQKRAGDGLPLDAAGERPLVGVGIRGPADRRLGHGTRRYRAAAPHALDWPSLDMQPDGCIK
jgi:hypothetical protein